MQCALREAWACDGGCALRERRVMVGVPLGRRGCDGGHSRIQWIAFKFITISKHNYLIYVVMQNLTTK